MPVTVQGPDGRTYEFPDGTTKDVAISYFKKKGIGTQVPTTQDALPSNQTNKLSSTLPATLSAGKQPTWLDDIESDIKYGGGRTLPGRILGRIQGRGDKGYSGIGDALGNNSGAEYVASPVLGAVHYGQGVQEFPQNPVKGELKALGGILEASQIPTAFMGGPTSEALINKIPSSKYAGELFNEVSQAVGNLPVRLNNIASPLQRANQLESTGATLPKVLGDLSQEPSLTSYSRARDFQSNLADLSRNEWGNMNKKMGGQVKQIKQALYNDILPTVEQAGVRPQYEQAMKEYEQAAKVRQYIKKAGTALIPAGLGAAGYRYYLKDLIP